MHILNTLFSRKIGFRLLIISFLMSGYLAEAQIYYHDFGTTPISTHPYTVAPTVFNSHLLNSSWSNNVGVWTSNTGATGEAIRLTTAATATITLTFEVAANYQVDVTSFNFWTLRSNLGPQNWTMTINGITAGSGTTAVTGAAIGNTPVANTISGLTGTITVVISLSGQTGNGTYRLDDFTLFGSVTSTCTAATITSFSPTSGPQNTLVTINGSGFQSGAGTSAVNFNGMPSSSFTVVSDNVIKAYIPAGNTSGAISVITNGCEGFSSGSFTLIQTTPNIVYATDLYISEIYDAQAGSGGVIEIYNGTASSINLSGYSIVRHPDIGAPASYTLNLDPTLSIAPGQVFLIYVGTTSISCTGLTYGQIYPGGGFNSNDQFELVHNALIIDSVQISQAIITTQPGFSITRNPDAIGPQPVFNINDWTLTGTESCTDLGVHNVTPPNPLSSISNQPTSRIICENGTTTFLVILANTAGYSFQWKVQSGTGSWVNVTNSAIYSGATTNTLVLNSVPVTFDDNQYYCEVTSPAGTVVSYAAQLTVNGVNNPPILTTTPPSCSTDGFTTITNYNAGNTYVFSPSGPTAGGGGIITGAIIGATYSVTIANGCTSGTPVAFTNLIQLTTPAVPILSTTAPICTADGFTTISNYNSANTYIFSPIGPTAITGGNITGATLGTAYTITATNGGCTSAPSIAFTNLNQLATPTVPTLSTTAPSCSANSFTTITNYNAANNYTFSPSGPTTGAGGSIIGATLGIAYTVTATNGGCTSALSSSFTNLNQLVTPAVPTISTTASSCSANGITTITNYNVANNYTFSPSGPTAGAGGSITGTILGTSYTVTSSNFGCSSAASASFTNVNQLAIPAVPTLSTTAPSCSANSSTTITNYNAANNYTFSPSGPTTGAGGSIIGTALGTAYTITATSGSCTSTASTSFINLNQLATPVVPTLSTTMPSCSANGFAIITNYNATNIYSFIPTGPTAGAGGSITGTILGTAYTITATNSGCTSAPSASFTNLNQLPTPAVPTLSTTAPTCVADGFTTITNYNTNNTYIFSPTGPSAGVGGIISGAILGTTYTITAVTVGCSSLASLPFRNLPLLASIISTNPSPLQACDPNNDGFETFDLTQTINTITGGNPNYTVTFHETQTDANVGATPILVTSVYNNINPWLQTIYIRVTSNSSPCSQTTTLQLIVNPTPEATTPQPYKLCDYTGAIGYEAFNLTSIIPEILGSINPTQNTVTFYTTLADSQTGTNAITNPGNYTNASINTQTVYVRVETIATGCYDIVELQLIVTPLPNSTQPNYPQYSLCDNDQTNIGYEFFDLSSRMDAILLGQTGMDVKIYPSLGDAQNDTNAITNLLAYQNVIQYVQTLGIRITNSTTLCSVISTMDIRVEPLPLLTPPTAPYTLCDENQEGYTTFDLTTLIPGLLNGITTYTVSFHETEDDAAINGTTIPNPASYINIHPFVQIIYARAEDNTTYCVSVIPIELNVNPSPVVPIALDNIVVCDDDSNPQDAITRVDLTQRTPDVLAQQPLPASNYTVEYYTTLALAQQGNLPIINDTNYTGGNGDKIWVRVENKSTGCFSIGTFDLDINTPLLLITPTPLSLCDDDANPNNQFHVFDLTVKNLEINQGTNYSVTYYPSLLDAQNNTNVITIPTEYTNIIPAVQTLGVVVSSPLPTNCQSITTLDIRVLPIPTPNTNPPALATKCDDINPGDMVEVFDLTVNEGYIRNGDPNLTFSYYLTQIDAAVPQNAIPVPTSALVGDNVWIRVENTRVDYLGHHCYILVEQALTVNPLPKVVQPLTPYRVCDDNADGIAQFDLTNSLLAPMILGTDQLPTDFTITFYLTTANASSGTAPLASPYTNVTPTSQNVYIRIENNATGCVNAKGLLTLAVEEYATATGPQTFSDCDNYGDPYDGVHQIDLTQYASAILNGQNPAVFLLSYYTTQADAIAGTHALSPAQAVAYVTDPDTDTIWVKVENSSNSITPVCYAITTINISVERYPNPIISTPNNMNTICVDFNTNAVVRDLTLDSGISNTADYTFEWFETGDPTHVIGTGPTYLINTMALGGSTRDYRVHVTSNSTLACTTTSATFSVIQSGQATIPAGTTGYEVTNAFSASQIITVLIEGYGTYEYSLDDGPRQSSNIFEDVTVGTHLIHVWDTEGGVAYSCEELQIKEVSVIDYPHYFTPNGDGIHDTWNIVGLAGQPAARIYIFDRYGKLLKQISSAGNGWDGVYNGHLLPSDDYWFTVDFIESSTKQPRQFKAHFAMKR